MPQVTVYSTQNCPYCRMVKAYLERHGVDYLTVDVGTDKEQAKKMIEISGSTVSRSSRLMMKSSLALIRNA